MSQSLRVGIGGPVGSGKTALVERLVPLLIARGRSVVVVTNDILTREDELHVKRTLRGVLDEERIVGVETGSCPHAAVREDPSMNLAALAELDVRFPGTDVALVESGGDNLTAVFSKGLVDVLPYEEDLAAVISFQLAHIILGHHIDTRYAFSRTGSLSPVNATTAGVEMAIRSNDRQRSRQSRKSATETSCLLSFCAVVSEKRTTVFF